MYFRLWQQETVAVFLLLAQTELEERPAVEMLKKTPWNDD
jgi:hypothetical protein